MKKILAISHQLSNTGAPVVLLQLLQILACADYQITVIAPQHGTLECEIADKGFRLIIDGGLSNVDNYANNTKEDYDFIIANSAALFPVAEQIRRIQKPVYWWIHEASFMLSVIENDNLFKNMPKVKFLTAGPLVYRDFSSRFGVNCERFDFGLEEIKADRSIVKRDKITFILPSTYCYMKGTDLAVAAILKLEADVQKNCRFIFIGESGKKEYVDMVKSLCARLDNVEIIPGVVRTQMGQIYNMADCVLIPSRQDPVSAIAIEALMLNKICLISDNTGVSMCMTHMQNGIIFQHDNIDDLVEKISFTVREYDNLHTLRVNGRKLFENNFSIDSFAEKVKFMFKIG